PLLNSWLQHQFPIAAATLAAPTFGDVLIFLWSVPADPIAPSTLLSFVPLVAVVRLSLHFSSQFNRSCLIRRHVVTARSYCWCVWHYRDRAWGERGCE